MRGLRLGIPVALAALAAATPLHGPGRGCRSRASRARRNRAPDSGGVQVLVDDRVGAVSDTAGRYRVRAVRTGWHRVAARLIGYRGVVLDSVFVPAGATVTVDFELEANPLELEPLVVTAPYDAVLDPLATSTEQKITAADLRDLPISSLEEALALSAGSVGTSYRGGRIGQESFILDGLGVKNQLDASSGGLGLQIPPDLLSEASLVTNGFSARYGQALSGLVNVVTREPGEEWEGRVAYEGDRPVRRRARPRTRSPRRSAPAVRSSGRFGLVDRARHVGPDGRRSGERAGARRIPAILARARPTRCRTTRRAVDRRGQAGRSDDRARDASRHWACTPRTSGCSTIRPTSTTPSSRRASGCAATW